MSRSQDAREVAAERIITEYRPLWDSYNLAQRDSAIDRITSALGISRAEAVQRVSKPACPQCGSSDMDRGAVDVCRVCSCISREGVRQ
jgi:transcription initiation factor TFIIIB Brf1 subunit/transcription initiation factor TFIIB